MPKFPADEVKRKAQFNARRAQSIEPLPKIPRLLQKRE